MRSFAALRMTKTPYLLSLPALLLFAAIVIVPLSMTVRTFSAPGTSLSP